MNEFPEPLVRPFQLNVFSTMHYTSPPSPPSISIVTGGLLLVGVLLIKAI